MIAHNPDNIAAPTGAFSHGVEAAPGARVLHVSGQVGIAPDGTLAADAGAQAQTAWDNIRAILAAAGMDLADIVKVTAYLTDPADLPAYAAIRGQVLQDLRPASTLVIVSALVRPEWKVEVEVVAARAG